MDYKPPLLKNATIKTISLQVVKCILCLINLQSVVYKNATLSYQEGILSDLAIILNIN